MGFVSGGRGNRACTGECNVAALHSIWKLRRSPAEAWEAPGLAWLGVGVAQTLGTYPDAPPGSFFDFSMPFRGLNFIMQRSSCPEVPRSEQARSK